MTGLTVAFVWAGGVGQLVMTLPAGQHVNPEAPSALAVNRVRLEGYGDLSNWKVPLPQELDRTGDGQVLPGMDVEAVVPVCADDGGTCTVVTLRGGDARPYRARGALKLVEFVPAAPMSTTGGTGVVVGVYDFAAVWCPPCNLLAAEVLDTDVYDGPRVTRVDADSTSSWPIKDRYKVGGYPTLVAVDAEGAEVARLVGYPGREQTLAWIAGLKGRGSLDAMVESAQGAAALSLARELAGQGDERARRLLDRVATPGVTDDVDFRIARLLLDGTAADALWLFDRGVPGGDWVYDALRADPTLAGRVPGLVPGADGEAASGWLAAAADAVGPGELGEAFRAGALAALEEARAGDLQLDRGRITDLASLRADLGSVDSAYALLDEASARWPSEFTWHFVKARIALEAKQLAVAEASARAALARSDGDQILRSALTLAKVLREAGRAAEAVTVLDVALATVPEPPPGVEVRTTRYRSEAQQLKVALAQQESPIVDPAPR
ncbi:MAG: thioredoxin family protein [Myxococcales bacterium]|nr:thioredoxin family protein [Myxococcales bacterium]